MKVQVRITRTDTGSNTRIKSGATEASKDYGSWDEALAEAERIGLINGTEATAAKVMPPGMPFHTSAEVEVSAFGKVGFVVGKAAPAQ
jgi:hypothetical protein